MPLGEEGGRCSALADGDRAGHGRPNCKATGVAVSLETVRRHLHAAGYVCKRPTWTLKRRAEEKAEYPGNAPGWRRC